jgi:hypothetical protein
MSSIEFNVRYPEYEVEPLCISLEEIRQYGLDGACLSNSSHGQSSSGALISWLRASFPSARAKKGVLEMKRLLKKIFVGIWGRVVAVIDYRKKKAPEESICIEAEMAVVEIRWWR